MTKTAVATAASFTVALELHPGGADLRSAFPRIDESFGMSFSPETVIACSATRAEQDRPGRQQEDRRQRRQHLGQDGARQAGSARAEDPPRE